MKSATYSSGPGCLFAFAVSLSLAAPSVAAPNPPAQEKIVGGSKAPGGAYPWMAALVSREDGSIFENQFCGGALIAPDWVLTAAHCVKGESIDSFDVWIGLHDLEKRGGATRRRVTQIILHPNYGADRKDNLFYDLALLRLNGPVTGIAPISLASEAAHAEVGSPVRAIGWGAQGKRFDSHFPKVLRQADLQIVDLAGQQPNYQGRLGPSHLAAASLPSFTSDTCSGDSGGPLFRTISNLPVLVGITSFGDGCARPGVAGIYAHVFNMRDWITATMADPRAPLIAALNKRILRLKKRAQSAKKRGNFIKAKRFEKKIKRLKKRRNAL